MSFSGKDLGKCNVGNKDELFWKRRRKMEKSIKWDAANGNLIMREY